MKSRTYPITELQVRFNKDIFRVILTAKGIHGRPYRPWGGVKGGNPSGWQGYCTHTSILFAPWHRPYLALFEV